MIFLRGRKALGRRLVLLAAVLCTRTGRCSSRASLFEFSEYVQELNPETFAAAADSHTPWAVDCYSPGCPHCTKFAPIWEQIGTGLRDSPIAVGAVNCVKHGGLCRSLKVHSYPTLMALNWPGAPPGTSAEPATKVIRRGAARSLDSLMSNVEEVFPGMVGGNLGAGAAAARELELPQTGGAVAKELVKASVGKRGGGVGGATCALRLEDAAVSVRWVLKNDVFTQGHELSKERLDAVTSFLQLLSTTFPGKMNRSSFRSLASELKRDAGLNNFSRWDKRIDNLRIGNFAVTAEPNWPAANVETGSDSNVVHFTSGLWSLFHALSVSTAPNRQTPHAVMEGIFSFVDNFFRCQECRSHFLEMYSACDNDRCKIPKPSNVRRGRQTPEEEPTLALWVWRMHNAVNARLAQEGDEEVEVYRSLWPSAQACEECWSEFLPGHNEPPWSETEVLNFLVATYSCPDAVGEGADSPGNRWAVTCVLVCAIVAVFMWARKWQEMRGVGLTKRLEDAAPSV